MAAGQLVDVVANHHGAGLYGASVTHKTRCKNSNNPSGHNPECPCNWAKAKPVQPVFDTILEADLAQYFGMYE